MSERKPGWYWVKFDNGAAGETWMPAHWNNATCRWHAAGIGWGEEEMIEIGPRTPTPDDPWQCVPVEPTQKMRQSTGLGAQRELVMWKAWDAMLESAPKPEEI